MTFHDGRRFIDAPEKSISRTAEAVGRAPRAGARTGAAAHARLAAVTNARAE